MTNEPQTINKQTVKECTIIFAVGFTFTFHYRIEKREKPPEKENSLGLRENILRLESVSKSVSEREEE